MKYVNTPEQVKGALQAFSVYLLLFLSVKLLIKYFAASHISSDGQTVVACSNVSMATLLYPRQHSETAGTSHGLCGLYDGL